MYMYPINKHFGTLFGFVRDIAQGRMGASKKNRVDCFMMSQHKGGGLRRSVGTTERVMGKRTSTRMCRNSFTRPRGGENKRITNRKRTLRSACGPLMLMEEGLCLWAFMRQGQKVDGSKAEQRVALGCKKRSRAQKGMCDASNINPKCLGGI